MARHNEIGQRGEKNALNFLNAQDYEILATNWRYRRNEVDIIARKDDLLVIVEVKTRSTNSFGEPVSFVDEKKQRRLIEAAQAYLEASQLDLEVRFDVIGILDDEPGSVEHCLNAFRPSW